ncbi:lytic transglycosylase domain-containing protein [Planotetraspora sp. A-T 1434]|nr:lytic transglycosylase domain-containing protein [Planotetraspora sp. A-T 1434]
MSSGQQLRDHPPKSRTRARRTNERPGSGWLTPKRVAIMGVTVAVLAGGTAYVVHVAIENANAPRKPLTLNDLINADPYAPNPEDDALKAAAVQALKRGRLKAIREGRQKLDPVKIVPKAPGGGGFSPADFPPGSSPDPGSNKALGKEMAAARGWGDEWGCLEKLWDRESHWNERAMNRYSGAYGIPQALPGSKMASAGSDWQTNAATQIKWGLGYIAGRYKTPCGAWGHSQATGWY